jgi:hypothetical protein
MRNISLIAVAAAVGILAFSLVNTCSATNPPAKTQEQVTAELMEKLQKDMAEVEKRIANASSLSERLSLAAGLNNLKETAALLQQSTPAAETKPKQTDTRSYVQKAGQEFSELVPVYAGNETEKPTGFGATYAAAMTKAEAERPEVAAVKVAVVERLQEAHTKQVLDQDALHIPEYSALLKAAPRNETVLETIQQERLKDESAIEELANPGLWTTIKWWWKS